MKSVDGLVILRYVMTWNTKENRPFYKVWEHAADQRDDVTLKPFFNPTGMKYAKALQAAYDEVRDEAPFVLLADHDFVPNPEVDWTGKDLIEDYDALSCRYKQFATAVDGVTASWFNLIRTDRVRHLHADIAGKGQDCMNEFGKHYRVKIMNEEGTGCGVTYPTGRHLQFSSHLTGRKGNFWHIHNTDIHALAKELVDEYWQRV